MLLRCSGVLVVLLCALAAGNAQTCSPLAVCPPAIVASRASLPALEASVTPSSTFRKAVDEVSLSFSVTDRKGHAVLGLTPDEFSVLNDHRPVSRLTSFSREESPLRLGLLVDWSDSVADQFQAERRAATAFLRRVMRPGFDEGFVLGFGARSEVIQTLTGDPERMVRSVRPVDGGWLSAIYDAILAACSGEMSRPTSGSRAHRAIVLLSDGQDNYSIASFSDAIAAAQKSEVAIYVLTTRGRHWDPRGESMLQQLTEETGGHAYIVSRPEQYLAAFNAIEEELRSRYTVSFKPAAPHDGRFHSVQIGMRNPNLKVHARRGYFAPP